MSEERRCREPELGRLIAPYELGLLAEEEQARFEAHLQDCPTCLEELYAHAPAVAGLTGEPERWAERLAALAAESGARRRSGVVVRLQEALRRRTLQRAWLPVGAAAAAVLALLLLLPRGGADRLRELARLEPVAYVQVETRAGGPGRTGEAFADGMAHYTAARYPEAAASLAAALTLGADDPTWRQREQARFFLGLSLLLAGNAALARPHLEATTRVHLRPLAERGRWYLAQCDLVLGDAAGARANLQALADSGLAYRAEAATQLAELQDLSPPRDGSAE
jgi:hypothetical protein